MKIAITGHKRVIGEKLVKQLTAMGHDIVGISRSVFLNLFEELDVWSLE